MFPANDDVVDVVVDSDDDDNDDDVVEEEYVWLLELCGCVEEADDGDGRIKYSNIATDEVHEKSKQLSIQNLEEQNAIIGHIIHKTTTRSEKE